ncbi:hypothetical protein [Flavobacterium silvaticum]|uniref:Uncharacterized protein n=1 Tax=Flavobacterium silvaticum TaxID=1852020 RepID=A0A972FNC7_9FLAO|nr:hypothetical protein [Flavobacterium silvaticum]NMH29206.1 hypothetical protein [Flavobacterium silvaticum]
MKKIYSLGAVMALLFFSCTDDRDFPATEIPVNPEAVLIHYWNFNSASGTITSVDTDFSLIAGGGQISYPGTGDGYMDDFDPGYDLNARNSDAAGSGIRARNPSDTRDLIFSLPSTGFKDLVLQFATARTGSGATTQEYSYSLDGTNFITTGLSVASFIPSEDPMSNIVAIDFTSVTGANDNANFTFRIQFTGDAAAGTSGNNRFDNVTLEGVPLTDGPGPGPDPTLHLFHYWNFNALPSGTLTSVAPDSSLITGSSAAITYPGTGAGYMDGFDPGSAENSRNGDVAGGGIRMRNPSNTRDMVISAPTTGYQNIIVKFATAKSSASGASVQNYSYTLNGTDYITANLPVVTFSPDIDPAYIVVTLDFTSIAGADNNASFGVKISFAGSEAAGSSGNNRFDNLTFEGNAL